MNRLLIKENYTSANLFNKINQLSENQVVEIGNGIEFTIKNYPNAVLIGGTALVHYLPSSRDLTPDIDFLIGDIEKIKDLLLNEDVSFSSITGVEGNIGISVDEFNTDYLDGKKGNQKLNYLILSEPRNAKIGGYNVNIINPELLAIMKLELGRDKDTKDGLALITSKLLNKNIYLKYLEVLKNTLQDYESLKSYSMMMFNV